MSCAAVDHGTQGDPAAVKPSQVAHETVDRGAYLICSTCLHLECSHSPVGCLIIGCPCMVEGD